jgi:hypothetical protein
VTLRRTDTPFIPDFLRPYQSESIETDAGYDKLYRRLTKQPEVVKPAQGKPRPLAPRQHLPVSSIQQNPPGASASVPVAPILATPPPALKAPRLDLTNLHVTRVPTAPTGYQFRFDLINLGHKAARDLKGKIVMIPLNYWRPPIVIPFSIGNDVFPNTQLSYVSRGVNLDPHSSERYIRISFQYRGGGNEGSLTQDFSYVWGGIPNFVPSNFFSNRKPMSKSGLTKSWTQQRLSSRENLGTSPNLPIGRGPLGSAVRRPARRRLVWYWPSSAVPPQRWEIRQSSGLTPQGAIHRSAGAQPHVRTTPSFPLVGALSQEDGSAWRKV